MAIMQASVLVSAFLVLLVPDFTLAQSAVRFHEPPPMNYGGKSDLQMMFDAGLNTTVMTPDDTVALVCNGLQDDVDECKSVMPFDEYARKNCERLFGITAPPLSRKKRHSSWSSSYWDRFWNRPFFNNNNYNYNNNNYNNNRRSVLLCPTAIDQSFAYQLNPDSTFYPGAVIGQELAVSPLLFCLTNDIALPEDPPQLIVQPFQLQSNATCPFTQLRLYGYQSLRFSSQCWVLQNFGDLIFYRQCGGDRRCRGCQSQSNSNSQKLCVPEYRTVNFWAYCPSLPFGNRFVRDKIIVPMACTCQDVPCDRVLQG